VQPAPCGGICTQAEIGSVGFTEDATSARGIPHVVETCQHANLVTACSLQAFSLRLTEAICDRGSRRFIGAHILGAQAAELVHTLMVAMRPSATAEESIRSTDRLPNLSKGFRDPTPDAISDGSATEHAAAVLVRRRCRPLMPPGSNQGHRPSFQPHREREACRLAHDAVRYGLGLARRLDRSWSFRYALPRDIMPSSTFVGFQFRDMLLPFTDASIRHRASEGEAPGASVE